MTREDIKKSIIDGVGKVLSDVYHEHGIKTGNISPEQFLVLNHHIENLTNLFESLVEINLPEPE